jgi:hypothetical protein
VVVDVVDELDELEDTVAAKPLVASERVQRLQTKEGFMMLI